MSSQPNVLPPSFTKSIIMKKGPARPDVQFMKINTSNGSDDGIMKENARHLQPNTELQAKHGELLQFPMTSCILIHLNN